MRLKPKLPKQQEPNKLLKLQDKPSKLLLKKLLLRRLKHKDYKLLLRRLPDSKLLQKELLLRKPKLKDKLLLKRQPDSKQLLRQKQPKQRKLKMKRLTPGHWLKDSELRLRNHSRTRTRSDSFCYVIEFHLTLRYLFKINKSTYLKI